MQQMQQTICRRNKAKVHYTIQRTSCWHPTEPWHTNRKTLQPQFTQKQYHTGIPPSNNPKLNRRSPIPHDRRMKKQRKCGSTHYVALPHTALIYGSNQTDSHTPHSTVYTRIKKMPFYPWQWTWKKISASTYNSKLVQHCTSRFLMQIN